MVCSTIDRMVCSTINRVVNSTINRVVCSTINRVVYSTIKRVVCSTINRVVSPRLTSPLYILVLVLKSGVSVPCIICNTEAGLVMKLYELLLHHDNKVELDPYMENCTESPFS